MASEIKLYLYSTLACHLCEEAEHMLEKIITENTTRGLNCCFEVVDIADDADLFKQYGIRIPVIVVCGLNNELSWPFDMEQLSAFIQSAIRGDA